MSEPQETNNQPSGSKKRSREKKEAVKVPAQFHGKWLCSASLRPVQKAIFSDRFPDLAFATIPLAMAYFKWMDAGNASVLISELAKQYDQPLDVLPEVPSLLDLVEFNGQKTLESWSGDVSNYKLWQKFTELHGLTVQEWHQQQKQKNAKTAKPKQLKLVLPRGMSVIVHTTGTEKAVQTVEDIDRVKEKAIEPEEGEVVKREKTKTTPAGVALKLQNFAKQNVDFVSRHTTHDGSIVSYFAAPDGELSEQNAKLRNKVGSALIGHDIYGPLMIISSKKINLTI